jgi:Protein kinase domain
MLCGRSLARQTRGPCPATCGGVQTPDDHPMSDPRIGSEVAGFRITSVLGHGGMGTVYVAEQSSPRRRVAMKLLRPDLSADEAFQRRFVHESEAAASTEHPNIVPIYASGESDGVLYIAMRYVEGTDLRERIAQDGAMPPEAAVEVVSQIAGALDAAHRRGLVHRDVKPGNILLDEHGNAYLTDFGLIKRSEVSTGITKTGQFMGSIEYCAPEQIRGEEVDGRADVYSLGCVLYECLAGQPPFKRDTEIATLYAHMEQQPPRLPAAAASAADLDGVLARAMAKRPSDRYPTTGELARDARRAVGVSSGERVAVSEPSRRRPIALVMGVVGLVAVLLAAVAVLSGGGGEGEADPGAAPDVDQAAVRLDPETGAIEQSIGGFTYREQALNIGDLAAGEGGVWVGSPPVLEHLDPVTETLRETISLQSPFAIVAVGFRTVWVSTPGEIQRINPATDERLRPVRLRTPQGITSIAELAIGEDAVWVTADRTLYRVDPVTGRVVDRIAVTGSTGLAVGEGSVWVADDFTGELTAFDEATGEVRGSAQMAGSLDGVAVGGGWVWVLDGEAGVVTRVDPTTLSVLDTVRAGGDERDIVFGAGALWLADGSDGSVTRIDPISRQTTVFDVGGTVLYVAVDEASDALWAVSVP